MIRAVVDANVLVSGAIVTHGASAFIEEAIKRRQFLFITCRRNLHETYRVLGYRRVRRKYRVRDRDRKRLIGRLAFIGEFVEPIGEVQICRDPADDASEVHWPDRDSYPRPGYPPSHRRRGLSR